MRSVTVEKGFYTCVRCGDHMLTAVVTDDSGRLLLHLEPLYCPECADKKERQDAWRRLAELKRRHS
jgi:DNA-directed RNA polymerase subunit RPC12/RpoP